MGSARTTDVLRRVQTGFSSASHSLAVSLQADMRNKTCALSKVSFTPESALAQAHELTNHTKEKITVTRKSCRRTWQWAEEGSLLCGLCQESWMELKRWTNLFLILVHHQDGHQPSQSSWKS